MEVLKKSVENVDPVVRRLIVEVKKEDFEKISDEVLHSFAKKAKVDGFRPGKAPIPLVKRKFEREIRERAVDELISRTIFDLLEELDLPAVEAPVVESVEEKDSVVRYTAVVEVKPEFHVRGYAGMKLKKTVQKVTDDDVNRVVENYRERSAQYIPIDREARDGDVVVITYVGYEGEEEKDRSDNLLIELGKGEYLPQFEDAIKGMKEGDTREVEITFPDDHPKKELAGKTYRYDITLKKVYEKKLPELTDEFVKRISGFENLEEWKKIIRDELEKTFENEARKELERQVLERLEKEHPDVPLPSSLVRKTFERLVEDTMRGVYLMKPSENMGERLLETAKSIVRRELILEKVAEQEGLNVSVDEILSYARSKLRNLENMPDGELENFLVREGLYFDIEDLLKRKKAMEFIIQKSSIEEA